MPKSRLLEFKSEDGWKPLCEFLGKPIPKGEPYPRLNDGDGVVKLHAFLYWIRLVKALGKIVGTVGAIVAAVGAYWWYKHS